MSMKEALHTAADLASLGLVLQKRVYQYLLADPCDFDPALVARTVGRLHAERIPVLVSEIITETPSTKTLRLRAVNGALPAYRPGKFVTIGVTIGEVKTSRAYSISSSPTRGGYLDITVRRVVNGFVSAYLLDQVKTGDTLELCGPSGCFYYEPYADGDDLLFLAGGSGITPFMSMIRHAVDTGARTQMHLIYGCRTPDDVIFGEELKAMASLHANIKVDTVISEAPQGYQGACGFLDAANIKALAGDLTKKTIFVCGPAAMYTLCAQSLQSLGVPKGRIRQEISGPPLDITAVTDWPKEIHPDKEVTVTIESTGTKITVSCGEPLLNALERHHITIANLCRSGECGLCRTKLLEGKVFMPPSVTVRRSDAACGYIHPCMSYPLSDLVIRL